MIHFPGNSRCIQRGCGFYFLFNQTEILAEGIDGLIFFMEKRKTKLQ